jgi:lipoprotein-releasing system permease protein
LLLTVLSVMNGFERELRDRILGILPHGAIYHRHGIEDWQKLRSDVVDANPNILEAAPFVELQVMLSVGRRVEPAGLYGIDVEQEARVSVVQDFIEPEVLQQLQSGSGASGIILGQGLARSLRVKEGGKITVLVPSSSDSRALPKVKPLTLMGIIRSGTELDHSLALVRLDAASDLSENPGAVSGLRIKASSLFDAPEIIYRQVRSMAYGYYGTDWTRTHGNLYHAVQMSKNLVGLLLFLIVAIAAFNVVSTLVMVVVDKQTDIAILKTLGASRREVMGVFMVQGAVIGATGTLLGGLLGLLGSAYVQPLVAFLEGIIGFRFLDSEVYPVSYLPSEIQLADFVLVSMVSLLMSLLATLYPAWRASRVEPAEALRFE